MILKTRSSKYIREYLERQTGEHKSKTKSRNRREEYRQKRVTAILGDMETLIAHPPGTLWTSDTCRFSDNVVPGHLNQQKLAPGQQTTRTNLQVLA